MTNLSFVFVLFVGLVFPMIAMTSLFLHVEKTRIF